MPNNPSPITQNFFHGLIDEVELFDRALSAAEIRAIFDAGSAGKRKPAGIAPPAGMVSWWPGDDNASDILDGNHGTLLGNTGFTSGNVAQAFTFGGSFDAVSFGDVLDSVFVGPNKKFTIDAWIKLSEPSSLGAS